MNFHNLLLRKISVWGQIRKEVKILQGIYRLLDANINRAAEGLRVLEDLTRFQLGNADLTEELKKMRHLLRKSVSHLQPKLLAARDSINDLGLELSQKDNLDNKSNVQELITGNFKRTQEALRVSEESLKVAGYYQLSKIYEELRFQAYNLEKMFFSYYGQAKKRKLPETDIYCITAKEYSLGRTNLEVVREMIEAGIKIIQYREKEKSMRDKYEECLQIRELTQKAGVTFIVNDDIALALSVKADGVHIGQKDLPLEKVRELVGEEMIIGLSVQTPDQAREGAAKGADYLGVGPIFATSTKKDASNPVGLETLAHMVQNIPIPLVAIGGIKEDNLEQLVEKGVNCLAMITEIVGSRDIKSKIASLRRAISHAKERRK
jgi:thiamine-phosphate pyrophosphorylase